METTEFVDRIMSDMEAEGYNEYAMCNILALLKKRVIRQLGEVHRQGVRCALAVEEIEKNPEIY